MKILYLFTSFILFTLFLSQQSVFATSTCNISSTLRLGSTGIEVQCLQAMIGSSIDGRFGPLTKASVITFQLNNKLVPDGIVGTMTRGALNDTMTNNGNYPAGCTSSIGYSPTTGIKCDSGSVPLISNPPQNLESPLVNINNTQVANPNLENLDEFIETVVEVNRKKGSSEQELNIIADNLRQAVLSSNIDYNKKFEELLVNESKLSANFKTQSSLSFFDKVITKTLSFFGINPPKVYAQAGVPFGGALVFPFFCAYNGSWMITMQPLPPSFVVLLTYYPGTQGFASYNIPITTYLLGTYVTPGVCIIPAGPYPITIPTEGTITPMVGSSLI